MKILDEQKIKNKIENRINEDIASGRVGGASIIVKQKGKVVYQNCFGQADNGKPLTESAMFRLASLTKPITAAAILKQVDKGLVSIDDPLEKFIPEFTDKGTLCRIFLKDPCPEKKRTRVELISLGKGITELG